MAKAESLDSNRLGLLMTGAPGHGKRGIESAADRKEEGCVYGTADNLRVLPTLVLGGTAGGMAGPRIPARTGDRQIGRLLIGLPFVTAAISLYNFPALQTG